jgi:dTMP kinase
MLKRLNQRKKLNRYDKFNKEFYKKVQKGFLKLALKNKKKYQIVDSNLDIDDNKSLIIKLIDKMIK